MTLPPKFGSLDDFIVRVKEKIGNEHADDARRLGDEIKKMIPAFQVTGRTVNVQERNNLTWALTKTDESYKVALIYDVGSPRVKYIIKDLTQRFEVPIYPIEVGFAQLSINREKRCNLPGCYPKDYFTNNEIYKDTLLFPGVSVSHQSGPPGSLGFFVTLPESQAGTPRFGIVGASHVFGRMNEAQDDDNIFSPAKDDVMLTNQHRCATDIIYYILEPSTGKNGAPIVQVKDYQKLYNTADIAIAALLENRTDRLCGNFVPSPNVGEDLLEFQEVAEDREMANFLGKNVYKFGRTTGLTSGKLIISDVGAYPVTYPDEKKYIFRGIGAVASNENPFSEPGDSGAAVFTKEGIIIGIIIGGTQKITFISPIGTYLRQFNAKLYRTK